MLTTEEKSSFVSHVFLFKSEEDEVNCHDFVAAGLSDESVSFICVSGFTDYK